MPIDDKCVSTALRIDVFKSVNQRWQASALSPFCDESEAGSALCHRPVATLVQSR